MGIFMFGFTHYMSQINYITNVLKNNAKKIYDLFPHSPTCITGHSTSTSDSLYYIFTKCTKIFTSA